MRIRRIWDPTPRRGPNEFLIETKQDPGERLGYVDPLKTHQREARIDKIKASPRALKKMRRDGKKRLAKRQAALQERAAQQKRQRALNVARFLEQHEAALERQKEKEQKEGQQ